MNRWLGIAGVLALPGCIGSLNERVHENFHQTVSVHAAPLVRVDNVAGAVEIEPWDKIAVDVSATKYGYDPGELKNVAIEVGQTTGGVSITTSYSGGTHNGDVRYHVFVPRGSSLVVNNVAGAVDIGAVTGNVTVETQAGRIDAGLGRVDGDRNIDLSATTGSVTLRLDADSSASVEARSTIGGVDSDFPGISESRENLLGARAAGRIGGGSARISLTTTTGAISLKNAQ